MRPIAVIDVGSNSICLMIAVPLRDGHLHVVEKLKDTARLRDYIGPDGTLSEAGMLKALAVLSTFRPVLDNFGAQVRAVATATLRAASNAQAFVQRARSEAGIEVEIITGDDEARLAFLGVIEGLGTPQGEVVCADVGGGSTELVLGRDGRVLKTASIPVGALVVTRNWLGPDPVPLDNVHEARRQIAAMLEPALEPFRHHPGLQGIATSGTIQRVARISAALTGQVRQDVDRMALARGQFDAVLSALQAAPTLADRLRIPGMDPSRADSLLGGALIHAVLAESLALPVWTVSMSGLRTGVLAEMRDRNLQ
jgi:exopolyphosphatase/guanosine-5'-triphosphate,3'-diphosphate pyrophosphatase